MDGILGLLCGLDFAACPTAHEPLDGVGRLPGEFVASDHPSKFEHGLRVGAAEVGRAFLYDEGGGVGTA